MLKHKVCIPNINITLAQNILVEELNNRLFY